jgi:vacuolar-type H+-ATPase subunit F/Vma7
MPEFSTLVRFRSSRIAGINEFQVLQARKETEMTEASRQPKDKNYNLIAVLYQSSDNVESLKTYIRDAEQEGDQELVEFFGGILENNLRAAQRAKEMLVPRFQSEQE